MNKTKKIGVAVIVIIGILSWIAVMLHPAVESEIDLQSKYADYIVDGQNCFVNGNLCKNISCDMPGGCYAKDCIGGVEYSGSIKIKCINITQSK